MIAFEDILKANALIETMDLKGKDYCPVNQRIKAFRAVCPDGFIHTEMTSNDNGICMFRAEVGYFEEDKTRRILGTGTAYEKESSSFVNKTSYIENCETSAVGRALGMAGFGIDTSIASAEEVQNAILNQEKPVPKAANRTTKAVDMLEKNTLKDEKTEVEIHNFVTADRLKDLFEAGKLRGWDEQKTTAAVKKRFGKLPNQLSEAEYATVFNGLMGIKSEQEEREEQEGE